MNPSAPAPSATDVIVIGGGCIGMAGAWALARAGLGVVLLDKGRVGGEATWASAGVLKPCSWNRHDSLARFLREGLAMYPAKAAELKELTSLDIEYEQCGSLDLLYTDQHVRMARSELPACERYREQYGWPLHDVLSAREAGALEPNLVCDAAAVVQGHWGAQVRTPRLIEALREACVRTGVRICEGQSVRGLVREHDRVVGVRTIEDELSAGSVVLAAGAWAAQFDKQVAELAPVYPVRGQMMLLHHKPTLLSRIIKKGKCYVVPRRDGHILIGSTEEHDSGFNKETTEDGLGQLLEQARDIVPALGETEVLESWAGLRPGTPDRRPIIGTHEFCPGLVFATGHFRTGLCLTWITAEAVRDLVIHGRTRIDLELCRPGRDFSASRKKKAAGDAPR